MQFSRYDKRLELLREIRMRERVYGRAVSEGRMTQADADRRIGVIRAIARDYEPRDLFSEDVK